MAKTLRTHWQLALVALLGLGMAACNQPGTSASDLGPYANGASYPWSDRLPGAPGSDPYANGQQYPWVGVRAGKASGNTQALNNGVNFLSDQSYVSATNGWGPIEKDKSNGEQGSGDGRVLTIQGVTYAKGLGIHSASTITYALLGTCSTFSAKVGIDDEVGDRGSVVFQVFADGTKIYDSGIVTGTMPAVAISNLDVTGRNELRLVVTNGGNNIYHDHADWADAQVNCTVTPAATGFLSDQKMLTATNGWGPVELDKSNGEQGTGDGRVLTIGGQTFQKGLGTHAASSATGAQIQYAINASTCSVFSAQIGIDDEVGNRGSVVFQVFGSAGGAPRVKLSDSGVLTGAMGPVPLSVDVSGYDTLDLVVTNGGDGIAYDHADWADAKVTCASQPATVTGVTVNPPSATMASGGTQQFTATVDGTGLYTPTVSWASSDTSVATVSSAGVVTAVSAGTVSVTATSTFDPSKAGSAQVTVSPPVVVTPQPRITVANVDGGPFPDWLSFSKVGAGVPATPSVTEHNVSTLRVSNTGVDPLNVSLQITGNFALFAGTPTFTVAPGASTDLKLRFIAETTPRIHRGTVVLSSNDPQTPSLTVQLAGAWQSEYENNQEPLLGQLVNDTFGFKTVLTTGGQSINQKGSVLAQGDEVLSPYWQRADATKGVGLWQLAAYHSQNTTASLSWHAKGSTATVGALTHAATDAQSVLPRRSGSASALAQTTFTPTSATFGFRVDGSEWSDDARNDQTKDIASGCVAPCGHHLRFYVAKTPQGQVMPDTYLLIMDYSGINYDYNDNIYLISNVRPAPILMDTGVAAGASFTDPAGNVWTSDRDRNNYAYFSPATAINEPATVSSAEILGTDNDQLYRSYRGNVGSTTPRTITYSIPLNNGTYQIKLHFAELNWTTSGKRVFDVLVNGQLAVPSVDIVAQAGAGNTALVIPISTSVTTGKLTLAFAASVDYPAISGIEISR